MTKKELELVIAELEAENQQLKSELQQLKNECMQSVQKLKNERGAGRKKSVAPEVEKEILEFRASDTKWSYANIAKRFNLSVGTVYNICKPK